MTDQYSPIGVAVTRHDFVSSEWKEVLGQTFRKGYSAMWSGIPGRQSNSAINNLISDHKVERHGKRCGPRYRAVTKGAKE